jgi:hypothetical protein
MLWRVILLTFLIPSVYGVCGWSIAHERLSWNDWLIARGDEMNWTLTSELLEIVIYILAVVVVLSIALGLTLFSQQMSVIFSSWFKNDIGAVISILGWSLAAVFIFHKWAIFSRVLILLAATLLGRLELQEAGYNRWQVFLILTILCLGSFGLGIWFYNLWGQEFHRVTAH